MKGASVASREVTKVDWWGRARIIDKTAACSFVLLALVTGLVYFAGRLRDASLSHLAGWVAMGVAPIELGVAVAITSYTWSAWRYQVMCRRRMQLESEQVLRHFVWSAALTLLVAWPLVMAAIPMPFVCGHIGENASANSALVVGLGIACIVYGAHWHTLSVYNKLAQIIHEIQQSPDVRHMPL
jgi:hypothetical protein